MATTPSRNGLQDQPPISTDHPIINGTSKPPNATGECDEWTILERVFRVLADEGYLGPSTHQKPVVSFVYPEDLKVGRGS